MATLLGSLLVSLGLETAKFRKGISDTERALVKTQKNFERIGTKIAKAGKALTVSLTAPLAGFGVLATKTAGEMRGIATAAEVAGESFEEFQRQAFAARTVQIEMEKLGDIFKDVRDRVGDFVSTGGGPMKDFFENIGPLVGVTAEAFRGLSGKDALQLYFDSLRKANVSHEETVFYLEAMASDATKLIPLLERSGAEFKELGEQAEVFTEADRAQLERYQVALDGIDQAKRKLAITLGTNLLPRITPLIQQVSELLNSFSQLSPELQQTIVTVGLLGAALGPVVFVMGNLTSAFGLLLGPSARAVRILNQLPIAMLGISSIAGDSVRQIGALKTAKIGLGVAASGAAGALNRLKLALIANPFTAVAVAVGTLTTAMWALEESQRAARAETNNLINSLKGLAQARSSEFANARIAAQQEANRLRDQKTRLELEKQRLELLRSNQIESVGFAVSVNNLRKVNSELTRVGLQLVGVESKIELADKAFKEAEAAARKLETPIAAAGKATGSITKGVKAAKSATQTLQERFEALLDAMRPVRVESRKLVEDLKLIDAMNLSDTERRDLRFERVGGREKPEFSFDVGPIDEEFQKSAERFRKEFEKLQLKAHEKSKQISRSFREMSEDVASSLDRLVNGIQNGGFLNILGGVIDLILQLGSIGVFGKGFAANLNKVPAYANGTNFHPGGLAIVGERGPELVNLPRGSGVLTNSELRAAKNDNTVRIILDERTDIVEGRIDRSVARSAGPIMAGGAAVAQSQLARRQSRRIA
ncbi:MAG: hypothetical protein AAF650_04900 [Pseudomonadota bacterium]